MSRLHLLWRIFYHSLYYFLSLILLLLLCVTPADSIRQSYLNQQRFHILIIIISLSVTVAAVICIYFFRLYVTRTALAAIPKLWVPIEKGDVRKSVRKMIVASLSRSAAIAFESRPRIPTDTRPMTASTEEKAEGEGENEKDVPVAKKTLRIFALKKATTTEEKMGIELPPHKAVWGEIEHYGWASPTSPDLPNLQYSTVIQELPNLIEGKALTLAPPAPESGPEQHILDPEAISLLQRPDNLGLRQYLAQLTELGVLPATRTTADFINSYEYARYSTRPISNASFRELMHLFAEILRNMQPLDPAVLGGFDEAGAGTSIATESDIDNDGPRESPSTPRSRVSADPSLRRQYSSAAASTKTSSSSGSGGSANSNGSQVVHRRRLPGPVRNSSQGTWAGTYRTAPTTPKSRRAVATPSPSSSSSSLRSAANSFAQTRRPYAPRSVSGSGSASKSSIGSAGSGGSVIRLNEAASPGELPYVLTLTGQ